MAMTKWVTFLLLLLALLAYGLSQMRPVPNSDKVIVDSTPVAVAVETTPAPDQTDTPPEIPAAPAAPAKTTAGEPTTKATPKSPSFGLPGKKVEPSPSPAVAANATKIDPFAAKTARPKRPRVSGTIKATVLTTEPDGGARTKFAPDTASIYLTATPEGLKDEIEVVAKYRSVLDEKAEFSEPVVSSGLPRRRVFRMTPPAEGWTPGPYQVTLTAKGTEEPLGLERFEIMKPGEAQSQTYPEPAYLDLVPDLEAQKAQTSYSKSDKSISLRVASEGIPSGTLIRSVWSAVEVDRLTAGELISVSSQPSPGKELDVVFTFEAPPGGFHTGSYKVDVYVDQQPAGSQMFFIQPPAKTDGNR